MIYLVLYLIIINLITCIVYGVDKLKAIAGGRRTPEKTLITLAFLGGSIGALAGMFFFRHKTLHFKFLFFVPLALVLQIVIIAYLCVSGILVV